jgi:predicted permease
LPGRDTVAVLAHPAWVARFGADPAVIGRRVSVDGRAVEIVGVMPPGFALPSSKPELLLPLAFDPAAPGARGDWDASTVARLRPGASVADAQGELRALWVQLARENPEMRFFLDELGYQVNVESLRDFEVAGLRSSLELLQVAALLVLLVAAANVAGLTLSRLAGRSRELALRSALGAGTHRLLRLVTVENLVLALLGGTAGLALALAALGAMERRGLGPATVMVGPRPDWIVYAVGLGLSVATGLLVSMAPAWWLRRPTLERVLRAEGRASTGGRGAQRFRAALVVGQVAVSTTLAVLVGLLGLSLHRLLAVDAGFVSEGVLIGQLGRSDEDPERRVLDRRDLLAAIAALPGMQAAGVSSCPPFAGCAEVSTFRFAGVTYGEGVQQPTAHHSDVSEGYFSSLGIPVVMGRGFTAADAGGAPVAVVDEAFAARWFRGRSPLGQRLELGRDGDATQTTIVGVVRKVRSQDLARDDVDPMLYTVAGEFSDGAWLTLRTAAPAGAVEAARAALRRSDPTTSLGSVAWLRDRLRESVRGRVAPVLLVGGFAGLATLLAALGVYAVLALAVARRRVELGVRAALGADGGRLLRMVLAQGARLLAAGVLLGTALALAASALVASLLFEVGRADPAVYLMATGTLAAVGLLACWLPAARAAAVEPTVALRAD